MQTQLQAEALYDTFLDVPYQEDNKINLEQIAVDVVDGIYDGNYLSWKSATDKALATAFKGLQAEFASYQYDSSLSREDNQIERLTQVKECLENSVLAMAKQHYAMGGSF